MNKRQKYICAAETALFSIAVFLFFRFLYPYHVHFQEQLQLFEFSWAYFADVVSAPGGFADYIGRFLTQFCHSALWGSIVIALVLSVLQLTSYLVIGRRTLLFYSISFVPSCLAWIFLCDENAIPGAVTALIICILAAYCLKDAVSKASLALKLALVPLIYFLCGPLAIVYIFLAIGKGSRRWALPVALLLLAASPFAAEQLTQYPLSRLFRGIHYYRYSNYNPYFLWAAAFSLILIKCFAGFRPASDDRLPDSVKGLIAFVAIAGATAFSVRSLSDMDKEEIMKYDFLASSRMWNRMMTAADKQNPSQPISVTCLNIALSQTGRMADHMFDYFQNGPQGLLPDFIKETMSSMATAEAYYHLGMVNTAQRFAFEAQEAIPDFQKSARCYRMLVRTNIINGDYEVAMKYIQALKNTLFYADWARKAEALISRGDAAVDADEEYGKIRRLRFSTRDFLFSDRDMDSMLGLLYLENKSNRAAAEYLLSWSLLKKDLSRFKECLGIVPYVILPEVYQEALILDLAINNEADNLPPYIEPQVASTFRSFMSDAQSGRSQDYMKRNYGSTYWFYYFYRYNN